MSEDPRRSARDLRPLVVRGVRWTIASQFAVQLLGLATAMVVARFLGPREVGLATEALVFGSLALVIVDFGFAAVLVHRQPLSDTDKSTAFWTGSGIGVALTLIGVALSWPIAALYGEPRVQPLFAVLSLAFLFTAPGIVQRALLMRELRFRTLELQTIAATTVSSATGISLAIAGVGAWAMVAQVLVITGLSTAIVWRYSPWRPTLTFSRRSLREMAGYASHVFGAKVLNWATINLDNLLIGRFLGATALGTYAVAFSLMILPVNRIATPLTQVFFPAFTKLRDRDRIRAAWLRAIRMVALVVAPAMLGLVAVAPDFVEVVFGERFRGSAPVLQILAPIGLVQALTTLNEGVLQALGRTRTLFRFTAALSALTVAGFAAGLPWGIRGVATAYLAVTFSMHPLYVWLTTREVGIGPREWLGSVAPVVGAALVMLAVLLGAREALVAGGVDVLPRLLALLAIGAAVYAPLVAWRVPDVRGELRELWERRRRAPEAFASEGAPVPPPSRD